MGACASCVAVRVARGGWSGIGGCGRLVGSCGIRASMCGRVSQTEVSEGQLPCLSWHKASCTQEHLWGLGVGGYRERRSVGLYPMNPESRLAPAVTAISRRSECMSRLGAGWAGRAADIGRVVIPSLFFLDNHAYWASGSPLSVRPSQTKWGTLCIVTDTVHVRV